MVAVLAWWCCLWAIRAAPKWSLTRVFLGRSYPDARRGLLLAAARNLEPVRERHKRKGAR